MSDSRKKFEDLFETRRINVKIPVLLALLPSNDQEYLQPNVNHHHFHEFTNFQDLENDVYKWVHEGRQDMSIELDAIIMSEVETQPRPTGNVAFNLFGVPTNNFKGKLFGEVKTKNEHLNDVLEKITNYNIKKNQNDSNIFDLRNSVQQLLIQDGNDGQYFLGFTDGLHRTTLLWKIMQSITEKSDFQEKISKNNTEVSIKVSFLRDPFEHRCLPELTAIVQEESGRIMKCKQQTVGHTLFDCYNTFACNSTTHGHKFLSILECKTDNEHCLLSKSDKYGKLKSLKWTSMLQDLFVQFFFNKAFETDCRIVHNKQRKKVTQFSGKKEDLQNIYPDAFKEMIWFPLLFQALTVGNLRLDLEDTNKGLKTGNKNDMKIPLKCASIFSLSRLFIFSQKMTKKILEAMKAMQKNSILIPFRLYFIQCVAYDASDFLVKHFKKSDETLSSRNWIIRYILRCNIEQQIFLLYKLVDSDFLQKVKITRSKCKANLDEYENEVIQMLHDEEPLQSDHKIQTLDSLVFIYVKYLVFLLAIDTIHSKSLPVIHLLLKTKNLTELETELSQLQDEASDNYLDGSCMLNESINLGNVMLKIDPASFVQRLFEKDESGNDQNPFVWLTNCVKSQQNDDDKSKFDSFVESYTNRFDPSYNRKKKNPASVPTPTNIRVTPSRKAKIKTTSSSSKDKAPTKKRKVYRNSHPNRKLPTKQKRSPPTSSKKLDSEEGTFEGSEEGTLEGSDDGSNEGSVEDSNVDSEEGTLEGSNDGSKDKSSVENLPATKAAADIDSNKKRKTLDTTTSQSSNDAASQINQNKRVRVTEAVDNDEATDGEVAASKSSNDAAIGNANQLLEPSQIIEKSQEEIGNETQVVDEDGAAEGEVAASKSTNDAAANHDQVTDLSALEVKEITPSTAHVVKASLHSSNATSEKPVVDISEDYSFLNDIKSVYQKCNEEQQKLFISELQPIIQRKAKLNLVTEFLDKIDDEKYSSIKSILRNPEKEYCDGFAKASKLPTDGEDFLNYIQTQAKKEKTERKIRRVLEKSNIAYENPRPDGHCMFRCISYQLEGHASNHLQWRTIVCEWLNFLREKKLNDNEVDLDWFIVGQFLDETISDLEEGGYAEGMSLQCLAILLQRDIVVLSEGNSFNVFSINAGESLDGKKRRALYMVIRDADAKKTMASEAYQKSIEVAKKSGTGNDLEKIRRRAEKKNHYLCIVPQYKIDQGTGSSISENVSIREGEKIKPWLDNLYDAICCEGNDISSTIQDKIKEAFVLREEALELRLFVKGLHCMSIEGEKPFFFTPTVNHHVDPKAIESISSEIDFDFTCILFYHDSKADKYSGKKLYSENEGTSSDDEDSSSSSEEEQNAKFLMHKEEYLSVQKETWHEGNQHYCSDFVINDSLIREYETFRRTPVMNKLTALLEQTSTSLTTRLSFLGSLDKVWRLLLEYQDCKLNMKNNPKDASSIQRFHACCMKKVTVKYYTIKHELIIDAEDVEKLELIFQKWSSVIEKQEKNE